MTTNATRSQSEDFVLCFKEVRRRLGEQFDDERFRERLRTDNDFATLAGKLVDLGYDCNRAISAKSSKTLEGVHPNFGSEFRRFLTGWSRFVDVYLSWKVPQIKVELPDSSEEILRLLDEQIPASDNAVEYQEFDPEQHSASSLVEELVEDASEEAASSSRTLRQLEAFDWINKRGLNLKQFEKRWHLVPWIAVPHHVSDPTALGSTNGLCWLINEAIRAFLFGADGAAIVMCRAITEELIEEHYLPASGTVVEPKKLWKNIESAEQHYPQLRNHNLGDRVRIANEVLHEGKLEISSMKRWSSTERFIREWITSLRTLVEQVP